MKNRFGAILMAVIFLAVISSSALAAPIHQGQPTAYNSGASAGYYIWQGKPTALDPGNVLGYFIWLDQNRWVLQTTTTGMERLFTGTIETDGTISDEKTLKSERTDGDVDVKNNKISFSFKTGGDSKGFSIIVGDNALREWPDKVNGLSFLATDANLNFRLYVDGQPIDTSNIYIGRANRHPSGNAFKIYSRNQ